MMGKKIKDIVSRKDDLKIGVLSFHNSKETKAIVNCIQDLDYEAVWISKENLVIEKSNNGVSLDPEVDVLINRLLISKSRRPIEMLGVLGSVSEFCPVVNDSEAVLKSLNKVYSTSIMSGIKGVKVPLSLFGPPDKFEDFIDRNTKTIVKKSIGTHGDSVRRVESSDEAFSQINGQYNMLQQEILQDEDKTDVRSYVVGDKVIASMRRSAPSDDWRTNIARGGDSDSLELPDKIERKIVSVAKEHGLDCAGVDLIKSEDGSWYFLEVNPTAGFKGLYNATEVNPAPYIVREAVKKIGGEVDSEEIEDLSKVLDDSVPDCRPLKRKRVEPEIGLVEDVYIGGFNNSEKVVAKVDTGAKRTSIDIRKAAELGLGNILDYVKVKTGSSKKKQTRPVVNLSLKLRGLEHEIKASIEDRSHMDFDIILGRDIIKDYKINPTEEDLKKLEEE